ncbi:MAG TPA: NAD(P)-dependent oxidoreductase [Caldimonas sp.]
MKILLLTQPMPAAPFAAAIGALAPGHELIEYTKEIEASVLADIDVVLGWQMPRGVASRMPKLRWVCAVAAGVEKLLVEDLAGHVPVSRIVDADQANGIAQYVVLMALRHARALPAYEALQRERQWRRNSVAAVRSRVGVLGTGAMGGVVAKLLGVVGFEVRGWSRGSAEPLEAVLGASDIVVCALPLTGQTQGLLDARAFAAMLEGSYLINVARGGHVVEADLIAAVRSGRLAGAALDVQRNEPMRPDDPLWQVPGITITPHIAAQPSTATIAAQFVEGLRCLERGVGLPQTIDRARGY